MDIAFLFWAIAVGIVLAAGLIPLAVFGSIFIGVVLVAFSKKKTVDSPYILVVHCENNEIEEQARIFVKSPGQAAEPQEQKRRRRLCGTQL